MSEYLHLINAAGLPFIIQKSKISIIWKYTLTDNKGHVTTNPVILLDNGTAIGIATPYIEILTQMLTSAELKHYKTITKEEPK